MYVGISDEVEEVGFDAGVPSGTPGRATNGTAEREDEDTVDEVSFVDVGKRGADDGTV